MQRQQGPLFSVLDRHKSHRRPRNCLADRFRIGRVVLVRLNVRLDELRRHQLYGMPLLHQFSGPKMCTAAGFHPDQARWPVGEERH
jgi:hypothetical protein